MMNARTLLALLVATGLGAAGCGPAADSPQPGSEGAPVSVPNFGGKADNYISSNSREFELRGTAQTTLSEEVAEMEGAEREEAVSEAIEDRLSTVTRTLEGHIDDAVDEANDPDVDEGEGYFMYARNDNEETLDYSVDGQTVSVDFEWEFVGSTDIVQLLVEEGAGQMSFAIDVEGTDGETKSLTIEIAPSPSDDAFPKYNELFADGVYDIGLHFGGDYNDERYDIEMAKWAVNTMLEGGWSNPEVDSFEDLSIDSPPFTKQMIIEGEEVEAQVYLYHPEMPEGGPQEELTEKLEESFAKRDVVLYNGHAGPGAGFILDYQPRHEVEPSQFDDIEMADKYQIFVINGCETYRSYVPDLMKNEEKTFENVDIVTTVNKTPIASFSQVTFQFLNWLTFTDRQGQHYPLTWNTILQGVNKDNRAKAHYGVHGIDQDPELNPHKSEGVACTSCDAQSQCGAGGNFCLNLSGGSACGVACATSEACGEGSKCVSITDNPDQFYIPKQCVPETRQCMR